MSMSTPDEEARFAAESILHSNYQTVQSPLDISHSHSINTIPSIPRDYITSEDMLAGQRVGRMSAVRRFFCLFVTFDLCLTGLMWIICVMLKGENIMKALSEQIYHYNIHTSLFDVVLVSLCRFVVLLFFYALIYINHWIVIALSTTLTCISLIAKVFVYDWLNSSQPVFEVLLVLTSFVLSWGEAWFLDFRVLPQESHASRYLITNTESERAPLIRSYVQGLPSAYTESVANFYSPLGTPDGSLYRYDATSPILGQYPPVRFSTEVEASLKIAAGNALEAVWELIQKSDWNLEGHSGNDFVYSRIVPGKGKIFKLSAQIDVSPRFLLDEFYFRVQNLPQWNSAVQESHKIQAIDEHTDICYQIAHDAVGGAVSSRDFINLRHWALIKDTYVMACVKTEHPSLPPTTTYVRGENGVGGYVFQPVQNETSKCHLQWILNTNLKLWLPKYILEPAFVNMMLAFAKDLRLHIRKLKESGQLT